MEEASQASPNKAAALLRLAALMNNRRALTAAERQRRYRQRQKCGRRVVCVEVDDRGIELLIEAGCLSEREGDTNQRIASAISNLIESLDSAKSK